MHIQRFTRFDIIILLVLLLLILQKCISSVESPRWLVTKGHLAQAKAALLFIRGNQVDVTEELQAIQDDLNHLEKRSCSSHQDHLHHDTATTFNGGTTTPQSSSSSSPSSSPPLWRLVFSSHGRPLRRALILGCTLQVCRYRMTSSRSIQTHTHIYIYIYMIYDITSLIDSRHTIRSLSLHICIYIYIQFW